MPVPLDQFLKQQRTPTLRNSMSNIKPKTSTHSLICKNLTGESTQKLELPDLMDKGDIYLPPLSQRMIIDESVVSQKHCHSRVNQSVEMSRIGDDDQVIIDSPPMMMLEEPHLSKISTLDLLSPTSANPLSPKQLSALDVLPMA